MILQHPPPGTDSSFNHPGETGRLVLYRDGLVSWAIDLPRNRLWLDEIVCPERLHLPELPQRLRLEAERHSLWHSRLSAAKRTGEVLALRGRYWHYDIVGRYVVECLHEDGGGPRVGIELSPVEPVLMEFVDVPA